MPDSTTNDRAAMTTPLHRNVIAIDGPAASGKSTVARLLARRAGAIFLDTGLLYRAVTANALRTGVSPSDGFALREMTDAMAITVRPASIDDGRLLDVLVNGEDVTPLLRTPDVDRTVSEVSAHPLVREALLPVQRRLAGTGKIVMVGRDIASVVVPDAGVKIYLDASVTERARRRFEELAAKGVDLDFDTVLADLIARDEADSTRDAAPLQIPDGATIIDSDGMSIEEVVDAILTIANDTWSSEAGGDV